MNIKDLNSLANNRWESIFSNLGIVVPDNSKHGACPNCGGKDRFRMDNLEGRGTFFCSGCGVGDGLALVQKSLNLTVLQAVKEIEQVLNVSVKAPTKPMIDSNFEQKKAIEKARFIYSKGLPVTKHSYLEAKQIKSNPLIKLSQTGDLIIPIFADKNEIASLQFISANGDKRMLKDCKIKGNFFYLGKRRVTDNLCFLAEGLATAGSIHEVTGVLTFCCFSSNNIYEVAKKLVEKYGLNPVLCADNDSHLPNNIGVDKAIDVSSKLNLQWITPNQQGDFNDLMLAKGKKSVEKILREFI